MKQKIMVKNLEPGMFVYELDRPWLDTPYLIQGFMIETHEDVEELAKYCQYVYIDALKTQFGTSMQQRGQAHVPASWSQSPPVRTAFHGKQVYRDVHPMERELKSATGTQHAAAEIVDSIAATLQSGLGLDIASAKGAINGLRESIVRNPDALLLLTRIRDVKSSAYRRAIDVAVYLLAFGRQLGLPKDDLTVLGLGGLLLDIGKLKVPPALLDQGTAYTAQDYTLMKRHVAYGEAMLQNALDIPEGVRQILAQHHEREDGSGYPRGLAADQISSFGRMAGIVDCYAELVTTHNQRFPVSPQEALQLLHRWSGRQLHPTLVEVFIQCIGIFPVGSLVELNTGEVGVVLSHNRASRLQPRLMLVLDSKKACYPTPKSLDLMTTTVNEFGIHYAIARGLEFGIYGVDLEQFDFFEAIRAEPLREPRS
jgi:HD-GYP domain-containing protein (c-di-GMP phosphodiesterase class II)